MHIFTDKVADDDDGDGGGDDDDGDDDIGAYLKVHAHDSMCMERDRLAIIYKDM